MSARGAQAAVRAGDGLTALACDQGLVVTGDQVRGSFPVVLDATRRRVLASALSGQPVSDPAEVERGRVFLVDHGGLHFGFRGHTGRWLLLTWDRPAGWGWKRAAEGEDHEITLLAEYARPLSDRAPVDPCLAPDDHPFLARIRSEDDEGLWLAVRSGRYPDAAPWIMTNLSHNLNTMQFDGMIELVTELEMV